MTVTFSAFTATGTVSHTGTTVTITNTATNISNTYGNATTASTAIVIPTGVMTAGAQYVITGKYYGTAAGSSTVIESGVASVTITTSASGGGGTLSSGVWGSFGPGATGILIIRYVGTTPKIIGGTITTSGGYTYHTFTTSGTIEITG